MSTKSWIFILYYSRDHNVQSWRKSFFFQSPRDTTVFWNPKKNYFLMYMWDEPLHILVLGWVRYMSTKSHIHRTYKTLRKMSFCTRGYVAIHIQRLLMDNRKGIWKKIVLKIWMVDICFDEPSTQIFYFFGQNLVVLGNFGQILLHL
jgi:hypothetical protein